MKKTKLISLCLVFVILLFAFSACGDEEILTETFTYGEFSIVLPLGFSEDQETADEAGLTYVLTNDVEYLCGVIESKQSLANYGYEISSLAEYAAVITDLYGTDAQIQQNDDYYYIVYEASAEGFDFKYLTCFFENDSAYLSVTYYTFFSLFNLEKAHSYMDGVSF
ncbi:MAG TPA: hypothetical protein P5087_00040 [Eubacteriales bacterium]|nr:hypothetical protein [Eubacteriales bacterium]